MTNSETGVPKTTAASEHDQPQPPNNATPRRTVDKRAEAVRAKIKKKRAAHRVALRRSHTGG
jgi:hypothetical protein